MRASNLGETVAVSKTPIVRGCIGFATMALAAVVGVAPSTCYGQEIPQSEPVHRRTFGAGMMAGGGYADGLPTGFLPGRVHADERAFRAVEVGLPTLELQWFNRRGYSLDLSFPVTDVATSLLLRHETYFSIDMFYDFNIGKGLARMIVGPGGGFSVSSKAGSLRIPAELGLELLTDKESFGVKFVSRPYVEMFVDHVEPKPGGGILLLVGISGYRHRADPGPTPLR